MVFGCLVLWGVSGSLLSATPAELLQDHTGLIGKKYYLAYVSFDLHIANS